MALNFQSFPQANYVGSPYGQPITTGTKPILPTGPQVLKVSINWAEYGASTAIQQLGVFVNLQAQGQTTAAALDAVRSVYIDNTYVGVPVYVQFPDTLFTIVCPAYACVMSPVFTNVQQFSIFGDGFQDGVAPLTNLFFSNVDRPGFYVPASITGTPTIPVILQYLSTVSQNISGNINIASVDIGEEDADRIIVCVANFMTNNFAPNTRAISSIVMGGAATTLGATASSGSGSFGAITSQSSQIWYAPVPTGTTMGVAVTTSGAGTIPISLSFYSIRNLKSGTPLSSGQNSSGTIQAMGVSLQTAKNGVVIVGSTRNNSGPKYTNATRDQTTTQTSGSNSAQQSSGSVLTNTDGTYSITVANAGAVCALAFA